MPQRMQRHNLADQLADDLTKAINDGRHHPGDQLPSVEKLAVERGIGRSTVREALRLLQARGLVEIIHGAGTFVSKQRITRASGSSLSFSEMMRARGLRPTSLILYKEVEMAGPEEAAKLQITPGEKVNILKRLRLADNAPISVETSISPHARFPTLLEQEWTPETSLYGLLKAHYGVVPRQSTHTVRAVSAGRMESQLLQIEPRSPVLMVEIVTQDTNSVPIEFGRSYYSSARYEYRVVVRQETS